MDRLPVSLCMIVKNEEKYLPACLNSVKDWVAEMIVVDTGSTDDTVAIAKEMGARVEHYTWHDDFAAARNYSLEFAQYPWILQLDADEEIISDTVDWFYESYPWAGAEGYFLTIRNLTHKDFDEIQLAHQACRFFRNKRDLRYVNKIHEHINVGDRTILLGKAYILHKGYGIPEAMDDRHERNEKMLLKELEEYPESPQILAYLAQHYSSTKNYNKAAEYGLKALENDIGKSFLAQISIRACCLRAIAQNEPEWLDKIEPYTDIENFPELLFYRADLLKLAGKSDKAYHAYGEFLDHVRQMDDYERETKIVSSTLGVAFSNRAHNQFEKGNLEQAIEMLKKAIENAPTFYRAYALLGKYYFENSEFEKAHTTFGKLIEQISRLGTEALKAKVLPGYRRVVKKIERHINKQ